MDCCSFATCFKCLFIFFLSLTLWIPWISLTNTAWTTLWISWISLFRHTHVEVLNMSRWWDARFHQKERVTAGCVGRSQLGRRPSSVSPPLVTTHCCVMSDSVSGGHCNALCYSETTCSSSVRGVLSLSVRTYILTCFFLLRFLCVAIHPITYC